MLRVIFKSWLASWPEWVVIILLFLALEIAIVSIEQAQWITPQPSLTMTLALAIASGWLLAKSRLPAVVMHLLAVVLGAAVTVWQASNLLPAPKIASRVEQLIIALQSWWQAINTAQPSEGTIHFAVFLVFFTWLMGYISIWFVRRKQNVWVAVVLGAVAILVNLGNLPEEHYIFFLFYLLTALFLVGMTSLAKHHYWFKKQGVSYLKRGAVYFIVSLLSLSILAVSTAWFTPETRVERLETLISEQTLWSKNIEEYLTNFLAAVPTKQPFLGSDEQKALFFGDSSFDRGDELQFVVISERPGYWRRRMYDSYTSSGWTSTSAPEHRLKQGIPGPEAGEIFKRREMTYTIVPEVRTDIVLTAGDFVSSDIPVSVLTLTPLSFSIDLIEPVSDSFLPADVAALAGSLREAQMANQEISPDELWRLLPGDLRLTDFTMFQDSLVEAEQSQASTPVSVQLTTVEVTRTQPVSSDIVAVTSRYPLRPDRRYLVTSSISSATPEDLSEAAADYPYWVTDYYLQLPSTLPERVRQLSETVTQEAKTPYDKVLAIERYLSQINYRIAVNAPPPGADGVDFFLFIRKSGNCVHFASAMAVMLRSIGVPARISVGYDPGEYDTASGSSSLRAKDRHAWPEVYFPGYGWIGFEPTPAIDSELEAAVAGSGLEEWPWWMGGDEVGLEEWLAWFRSLDKKQQLKWLESMDEEERQAWLQWLGEDVKVEGLGASGLVTTSRNQSRITLLLAITAAILLVYSLGAMLSRRRQRFLRADYPSEVYRKLCRLAALLRLGPQPQQTPWEYYSRLTSVFPRQAEAFDCIVQTYVERQFSRRKELDYLQKKRLEESWHEVYSVLLKRLFRIRH